MTEKDRLAQPGAYGDDDPGGGPYDEATGLRDWYNGPASQRFAESMRFRRQMLGITQARLAERLTAASVGAAKYYDSTIAKIENRQRKLSLDEAAVIARVLGVDLTYMTRLEWPADLRAWIDEQHRQQLEAGRTDGRG